jgi:hypothetical protein
VKLKAEAPSSPALKPVPDLPAFEGETLEDEVIAMVHAIRDLDYAQADVVMAMCMGYMARCTEIWLQLLRIEGSHRKAKTFRVMHLQKVMDLIEFEYKAASRLIEVRRQEVELSR